MGRSWVIAALLCACTGPRGPGTPKRLSVDRGEARAEAASPAFAGVDVPGAGAPGASVKPAAPSKLQPTLGLGAAGPSARAAPPPSDRAATQADDAPKDAPPGGGALGNAPQGSKETQRHDPGSASAPTPDGGATPPSGGAAPPAGGGGPPASGGGAAPRSPAGPVAAAGGSAGGPSADMSTSPKGMDLPPMSGAKGGQVDKLLENRLDVTAYRVQISKTNDFTHPIFDQTFDVMKPIDLFAEFSNAGVEVDQNAYWVRIALIDLLDREEKFTTPRLYGLDKKRKDD